MIQERLFVLKVSKHGESDLIIRTLNREGAKVSLFAKAALKSKKRFGGGVLEPTHYIMATYKPHKSGEGLSYLNEAKLVNDFPEVRKDYDHLELALYMVDVIEKFCQEGLSDNPELFNLLGNGLKCIKKGSKADLLKLIFQAKLLMSQGVLSETEELKPLLSRPVSEHDQVILDPHKYLVLKRQLDRQIQEFAAI